MLNHKEVIMKKIGLFLLIIAGVCGISAAVPAEAGHFSVGVQLGHRAPQWCGPVRVVPVPPPCYVVRKHRVIKRYCPPCPVVVQRPSVHVHIHNECCR